MSFSLLSALRPAPLPFFMVGSSIKSISWYNWIKVLLDVLSNSIFLHRSSLFLCCSKRKFISSNGCFWRAFVKWPSQTSIYECLNPVGGLLCNSPWFGWIQKYCCVNNILDLSNKYRNSTLLYLIVTLKNDLMHPCLWITLSS